ncbi:hypothetical protein Htur_5097 (plasmid) [Haloterrigena turkmenica DSM 5511]|uniref:HNH endonuclease 5 domain-containing protein n=1 Tax=Haloterrigena turkmenica (strain ATCC 51198 / DSM 5511 / JCM 9101 / NCIMB 13204 / VKM B-1734 / 4k) TaxID=543526 RepID=D2S3N7_HALTV|nr:HNH endonuclease [Haloterrigena turkmenica]ADB63984.1 hypothetical protein Htur_5097 [Haloterrigena turkmenica DSM 5511]
MTTSEPDRDDCYFCESSDDLEEHHIAPQRLGGSDSRDNLVIVCHDCHWKLERLYNKDFYEQLGIDDPRTTREKHITCDIAGCTNQAVEKSQQPGTDPRRPKDSRKTAVIVYRCEGHANGDPERDALEQEILDLLANHSDDAFLPGTIADQIETDASKEEVESVLSHLRVYGRVKRYGKYGDQAWQIEPNSRFR